MPRIRRKRTKCPIGFEILEDKLDEFEEKMREAVLESHDGKRKAETTWPIIKIHHQRSRYIFEMYKKKEIKRTVFEFCIRQKYADANLIAKWKKVCFLFPPFESLHHCITVDVMGDMTAQSGFERLCCMQCIQPQNHTFGTSCICRVPKADLAKDKVIECVKCGCRGCASGD